jgi:hypothetical protein
MMKNIIIMMLQLFTNYCSTPFTSTVAYCNQPKALITSEVFNYEQMSE